MTYFFYNIQYDIISSKFAKLTIKKNRLNEFLRFIQTINLTKTLLIQSFKSGQLN